MTKVQWHRKRVIFPVRFTHGPDGLWRGAKWAKHSEQIPERSGWFALVEYSNDTIFRKAYRPIKPTSVSYTLGIIRVCPEGKERKKKVENS